MAIVLLPFPFAGDGYTLEYLRPGDERDFGDCLPGLVAEGFVADKPAEKPAAAASAPSDGQSAAVQPQVIIAAAEPAKSKRDRAGKK